MTTYTLHMVIGIDTGIPPITIDTDRTDPAHLAREVHRHAKPRAGRTIDVRIYPDTLTGTIHRGHGTVGHFTLEPEQPEQRADAHATDATDHLRHGYTLRALNSLVGAALSRSRWYLAADLDERTAVIRAALIEHLYTADTPPTGYDLIGIGMHAVDLYVTGEMRHHGYDQRDTAAGPGVMAGFQRYWRHRAADSLEDQVIERVARAQIWPLLTPGQQQALTTLAATEDHQAAAHALGATKGTYMSQLNRGRSRFAAWWHEGETPVRRRKDKRVHSRDGTWHGRRRLTVSQVDELRARYRAGGVKISDLAEEVGMSRSALGRLISGEVRPAPDRVPEVA